MTKTNTTTNNNDNNDNNSRWGKGRPPQFSAKPPQELRGEVQYSIVQYSIV